VEPSKINQDNFQPEASRRGLVRWTIKQTVFVLILAAALFLSAGRWDIPRHWIYLGLVATIQIITAIILIPRSPELLVERAQLKKGTKKWDILPAVLMGYSSIFIAIAAGLETRYSGPPPAINLATILAMLVAILGTSLTLWAMLANPFFSGVVRIQTERGHTVASTGPYQTIRHPGYAGMLVFTLAAPAILGSWWALGVALLVTVITFVRTSLEDQTLQHELDGYKDYAQQVRFRLVPGVW
jgi:protein-S-isoprenylcysteine O-methyltransferase Ste14